MAKMDTSRGLRRNKRWPETLKREIEGIEQLPLIVLQPPHHHQPPPIIALRGQNHCSIKASTHFRNKIGPRLTNEHGARVDATRG